jgi:hypothetical protein
VNKRHSEDLAERPAGETMSWDRRRSSDCTRLVLKARMARNIAALTQQLG